MMKLSYNPITTPVLNQIDYDNILDSIQSLTGLNRENAEIIYWLVKRHG